MKKVFLFSFILISTFCVAQPGNVKNFDRTQEIKALKGEMLSVDIDKAILETGEGTSLTLKIFWVNNQQESPVPEEYDYSFEDPATAPWKIAKWEILEGGGEIKHFKQDYYIVYKAPAVMPAKRYATIAVTLEPQKVNTPKVQIIKTIYLVDNQNAFYFDCPYLGVNSEKYVIKNNGGQTMGYSEEALKKLPPEVQNKVKLQGIKTATADITATEKGLNIAALTSNAKAVYAKETNTTTLIFNDNNLEMINGKPATEKKMYVIQFSFPGQEAGKYFLKTKKEITASIAFPQLQIACACSDDPEEKKRRDEAGETGPTCKGGEIVIKKYDKVNKIIEGYIFVKLEGADAVNKTIYYSDLHGRFKVPLAN